MIYPRTKRRTIIGYASSNMTFIWLGRIWWKLLSHNFGKKVLCLTCLNNVFLVTDDFCIKWVFWKNLIFCLKNAFFSQKLKYIPLFHLLPLWCQWTFFLLIFFYLNSEGFIGGRWRRWWNPPMNIFNSAKNGPFLEDKKKKLPKVTGTLYIECV